jgi:hypothetical protein
MRRVYGEKLFPSVINGIADELPARVGENVARLVTGLYIGSGDRKTHTAVTRTREYAIVHSYPLDRLEKKDG